MPIKETSSIAALSLNELQVGYDGTPLSAPISGDLFGGETLLIVGTNGSGKSTLLRTILGLQPPVAGRVSWSDGAALAFVRQRHDQAAGPERVIDAVESGLVARGGWWRPGLPKRHRDVVDRCVRDCGLEDLLDQQVSTLSEGQKQRVMLGRALATGASVLVLDEPTAAMDAANEAQTFDILMQLQDTRQLTLVIVTHRVSAVAGFAHRGLFMDRPRHGERVGACVWAPLPELWSDTTVAALYPAQSRAQREGGAHG